MRIGLFTDQYYPIVSGVVTSMKMLYETLEAMGHKCYIFCSFNEKKISKEDLDEINKKDVINLRGINYPFKAVKDYRFSFKYRKSIKLIKEYKLDVIHLQTEFYVAKVAMKASKKLHIPLVHTVHTSWKDYIQCLFPKLDRLMHPLLVYGLRHIYTKPISKRSEIEILPTKKVLNDLETYGIKTEVRIVPTGIETTRFRYENQDQNKMAEIKKSLGIKETDFVFCYVGRISLEKNINILLEAFGETFKDNNNVKMMVVGGGPELPNIMKIASKYPNKDNYIFTEMIPWENVPLYYGIADVFMNASKSETQGLTYIEALSSSTPALVQVDDAIDGVIENNVSGYLFNSKEELIEKMKYIYNNQDQLSTIVENGLKVVEKYSKENFAKSVLEVFEYAIDTYKRKHSAK